MNSPAGFWIRFGAALLDGILIGIPLSFLFFLITGDWPSGNSDEWWINTVSMLYAIILPVKWHGYVVGKRIVGVRVVKTDGSNVTIGTMLLRVIVGALVYGITLGIGFIVSAIMVGARKDKRSLHDLIAGTYVTCSPPSIGGELKD
ncbi:RDD family protein [Fictibacillus aquaticus]|uniref:RDD domain-containing protein n=1 Tax=Fictibacillus aquaticus TaxID=2021314 RepID=A0A235F4J7_9BACL|nr:RDD family protein [Fictibacillus aquaticus]OYD56023.1 hypothetical protein CGZ90_19725 [Fictibacillus aquaticus]